MDRKMYLNWVRLAVRKGTKIEKGAWSKKSRLSEKKGFATLKIDYTIGDSANIAEVIADMVLTANEKQYTFVKRFDIHFRNGGERSGEDFELSIIETCKEIYQCGELEAVLAPSAGGATFNMCIHNRQKPGSEMIHNIFWMGIEPDSDSEDSEIPW